ncbi:MAG TPA: efflux RND transporter permease subunit [Beijerinckiaceae bacterium]|nr:efflux RND transporter permease subunit [Beijerinckiaceae bacterium]
MNAPSPGLAGRLTRAFITSPLTPLFLIVALALGLVALVTLAREEEPQISVPMVDIHVRAEGLRADDAVKLVTEPLEAIIKSINSVEHVYSQTLDHGVVVTARFMVGTASDAAILRVHEKIRANIDRIPAGIPEPLVVGRGIDDVAIAVLTLTPKPEAAERWTAADLTRLARELRTDIAKLDNVGLTYLVGETPEEIRITPDPERLARSGLTLQALTAKIQSANSAFPAGTIRTEGRQLSLIAGRTLATIEEIANLSVTTRDDRPVYVRDVATIGLAQETEVRVAHLVHDGDRFRRAPAVSIAVAKRAGANAVIIADQVLAAVERARGTLVPADIEVIATRNYGETANEKANELLFHLGLATLSIVALVFFAIGRREALVVAVVIPVTILLTLFSAKVMGYTLNRVSLFALIFSIGILVDDAIVVIENIARHWDMADGRDPREAAIDAVAEVGNPTIVATLTVVAALLPMLFVSGLMGPYMSPIPSNASAAMIFSFFVAVTVTPWLMLKLGRKPGHTHGHDQDGGLLGRLYRAAAAPVLTNKPRAWAFLLIVLVLTLGSLAMFQTQAVTVKLLPFDDKPELSVMLDLPRGTSVEDTDRTLQEAAAALRPVREIATLQSHAGTAAPFNFNGLVRHSYLRGEPHMGDLQLNLVPKGQRKRPSHAIALDVRERLKAVAFPPGTVVKVVEPPPGPPVLATLLAEIYGPTPDIRRQVAEKVKAAFRAVPFIVDIDDTLARLPERRRLTLVDEQIQFHKVEQRDVFETIRMLYGGSIVGYSHRGDSRQPIPIRVALDRSTKVLDERALAVPVPANVIPGARGVVELGDVVRIETEQPFSVIFRRNGRAAEMVMAELAGSFEAPLYGMIAVQRELDRQDWSGLEKPRILLHGQPDDTARPALLWDGEWEVTWVTFRDMGAAFAVAMLGIYILVVAQFGSFKLPLVILTPVPLTFIGIMLGHWLFGAPFSATSMIGFIALAGIIVRNSILLVDFIRHAPRTMTVTRTTEAGTSETLIVPRPLIDILLEAGAIRFKPILLTALAAMIGAVTILNDPIFQGLAISLLFGLASSTLLTLLVIPAIYIALRGGPEGAARI